MHFHKGRLKESGHWMNHLMDGCVNGQHHSMFKRFLANWAPKRWTVGPKTVRPQTVGPWLRPNCPPWLLSIVCTVALISIVCTVETGVPCTEWIRTLYGCQVCPCLLVIGKLCLYWLITTILHDPYREKPANLKAWRSLGMETGQDFGSLSRIGTAW